MTAEQPVLTDALRQARREARDAQEHTSPPHTTHRPAWASWPKPEREDEAR